MTISGDAVRDGNAAKHKVLGKIKHCLWNNTCFANFCNSILSAAGVHGSLCQKVVLATETFDLTFIPTQNSRGEDAPVYQLTRKPITTDPVLQHQWLALIRGHPGGYVVDMHALIIDKHFAQVACPTA
jgi:hypothetical protein